MLICSEFMSQHFSWFIVVNLWELFLDNTGLDTFLNGQKRLDCRINLHIDGAYLIICLVRPLQR